MCVWVCVCACVRVCVCVCSVLMSCNVKQYLYSATASVCPKRLCPLFLCARPLLFVGPTGTGKSAYVQEKLMHGVNRERYISSFLSFSAQTSANMTQVIILNTSLFALSVPHSFSVRSVSNMLPLFSYFNFAGFDFLCVPHSFLCVPHSFSVCSILNTLLHISYFLTLMDLFFFNDVVCIFKFIASLKRKYESVLGRLALTTGSHIYAIVLIQENTTHTDRNGYCSSGLDLS